MRDTIYTGVRARFLSACPVALFICVLRASVVQFLLDSILRSVTGASMHHYSILRSVTGASMHHYSILRSVTGVSINHFSSQGCNDGIPEPAKMI